MSEMTASERGYNAATLEHCENGKRALEKMVVLASSAIDFDDFDRGVLKYWEKVKNVPVLRIYCQIDGFEFKQSVIDDMVFARGFSNVISVFKKLNEDVGAPLWGWHLEY